MSVPEAAQSAVAFLERPLRQQPITVLNVAGPRASGWSEGHSYAGAWWGS